MPGDGPAVRLHGLLVGLLLGRTLPADRRDGIRGVFAEVWARTPGHTARARLLAREAWGLVRLRWTLGREARAARDSTTWEDGMDEVMRSVVLGVRGMLRRPVVSLAAVVTLGLGIGGTTAVYSLADGVLLDPLPFPDSDELVLVLEMSEDGSGRLVSYENFRDLQAETRTLESLALWTGLSVAVTEMGEPERIRGEFVSASYFDVLGMEPVLGRTLLPGEDVPGGERTAVLAHRYWERRFASDPGVLGRTVVLNNRAHTVVGVMPPDFRSYWDDTEAWISLHSAPRELTRGSRAFFGLGRLADGVDRATARQELEGIMARLREAHPEANAGSGADVRDLTRWVVGDDRRALVLSLLGAIAMVLLIATANVAGLQLARASERSREMAIRSALGGGRRRLVLQLLVENLVVAGAGGLLGLAVAAVAVRGAARTFPGFQAFDITLHPPALVLAGAVTLGVGLLAGLWPALRASGVRPGIELRESGRGESQGRSASRFRSALLVGQMALAVTLLVGAGLLVRTVAALNSVEVGFQAAGLLTGETRLTAEAYREDADRVVYLDRVVESLSAIPGTEGATLVSGMPFSGDGSRTPVRAEGSSLTWEQAPVGFMPLVAPGYFEVMGIELLDGRGFQRTDDAGAGFVLVVSRSLADRIYPEGGAVGRTLETPEGAGRIVGIVDDVRNRLAGPPEPMLYLSYRQAPPSLFSVLVRTQGPPDTYQAALKEAFWAVDSNQPLWEIMPLDTRMASYTLVQRFTSALLGSFALLALALTGVGMYGVVAHAVTLRRREMGIRLAMGADGSTIRRMVLGQGLRLAALGGLVGLAAALALSRGLRSLVFGVSPSDPLTYLAAVLGVSAVALLACWIPAVRATRVDPTTALKE